MLLKLILEFNKNMRLLIRNTKPCGKRRWLRTFPMLLILCGSIMSTFSCSKDDGTEYETFSLTRVMNRQYPFEPADISALPAWLQGMIENELSFPNSFVVKAKSGSDTVYIVSSLSSASPIEYYKEDGSKWSGNTDKLSKIIIIYWNSVVSTKN